MPKLVANRAHLGRGNLLSKQSWGHEDPHEYHNLHTDEIFFLGNEEDQPSGLLERAVLPYLESIAEQWDKGPSVRRHPLNWRRAMANPSENLRLRLENANSYFRRKASAVFGDSASLALLKSLYEDIVVDISDFDACENGLPLAKLTAANFCEVGAKVIHITEAGQQFIDSLKSHGRI